MSYPWVVVANAGTLVGLELNIIEVGYPILIIDLLGCQSLLLSFCLLQSLSDIVLARCWLLLLLLALHNLVDVGLLIGVVQFEFALLRPLLSQRVLSGSRDYFTHLGLIIQVVASLGDVPSILLSLL
jgi:hypothetical protein